jgi:hypothetical protein
MGRCKVHSSEEESFLETCIGFYKYEINLFYQYKQQLTVKHQIFVSIYFAVGGASAKSMSGSSTSASLMAVFSTGGNVVEPDVSKPNFA